MFHWKYQNHLIFKYLIMLWGCTDSLVSACPEILWISLKGLRGVYHHQPLGRDYFGYSVQMSWHGDSDLSLAILSHVSAIAQLHCYTTDKGIGNGNKGTCFRIINLIWNKYDDICFIIYTYHIISYHIILSYIILYYIIFYDYIIILFCYIILLYYMILYYINHH